MGAKTGVSYRMLKSESVTSGVDGPQSRNLTAQLFASTFLWAQKNERAANGVGIFDDKILNPNGMQRSELEIFQRLFTPSGPASRGRSGGDCRGNVRTTRDRGPSFHPSYTSEQCDKRPHRKSSLFFLRTQDPGDCQRSFAESRLTASTK